MIIYFSLGFFQGCMPGFTGVNCSASCPYPYYCVDCQSTCECSKDKCDVSTGCNSRTTGKQFKK